MIRHLLFVCLICFTACGGNDTETTNSKDTNDNFWTNPPLALDTLQQGQPMVNLLSGIIDSVPVEMQIVIYPDMTVRGSYFYKKYNTLLPFRGRIYNDGRINLAVYDIQLEETEQFKGKIDENWQFRGNWQKIEAGAKKVDFDFKPRKENDTNLNQLTGTYQNNLENYVQTLSIRNATAQQFEFQMVITSEFCSGEVEEGIAYFHNSSDANFYGEEGCYVNFDLEGKAIKVGETDCSFYHGMRCMFDGAYQKVSSKVEWIDDFYASDEELDSLLLGL